MLLLFPIVYVLPLKSQDLRCDDRNIWILNWKVICKYLKSCRHKIIIDKNFFIDIPMKSTGHIIFKNSTPFVTTLTDKIAFYVFTGPVLFLKIE